MMNFTNNGLSMAPLIARSKRERPPFNRDAAYPVQYWVYRCGVINCPEVLFWATYRRNGKMFAQVTEGYKLNASGHYIKTRRCAKRFTELRTSTSHFLSIVERRLALLDEIERIYASTDGREREEFLEEVEMREQDGMERDVLRNSDLLKVPETVEKLPITVKCGRCGRLSKIIGAG